MIGAPAQPIPIYKVHRGAQSKNAGLRGGTTFHDPAIALEKKRLVPSYHLRSGAHAKLAASLRLPWPE